MSPPNESIGKTNRNVCGRDANFAPNSGPKMVPD
jgi:hypothetical protein